MKKINLTIIGCEGRMGKQLIRSAKINKNFKLVSLNGIFAISLLFSVYGCTGGSSSATSGIDLGNKKISNFK